MPEADQLDPEISRAGPRVGRPATFKTGCYLRTHYSYGSHFLRDTTGTTDTTLADHPLQFSGGDQRSSRTIRFSLPALKVSRHRSMDTLRGYIRRGSLFVDNAAAKVGL